MTRIPSKIYHRVPRRLPPYERFSNYCLDFNANYVQVPDAVPLRIQTGTVGVWFKSGGAQQNYVGLIAKAIGGSAPNFSYIIYRPSWDAIAAAISDGAAIQAISRLFPYATDLKWHEVVFTLDGSWLNLYLDAVPVAPVAQTVVVQQNAAHPVNIGRWWPAGPSFLGRLDEAFILSTVWNAQQVRESFYRGYARREAGSVLNLRLEEGSGLTAYDDSGYGQNGSLLPIGTSPAWTPVQKYELLAEARI